MVRKTKEAALETRERLLDAAEQAFRRQGVSRTSLAEVAQAAGVTRGAVYWHFRDKAALFRAMCDRATLPLDALFEREMPHAQTDPLGALRTLCVGALVRLACDARTQNVFEILFHKSELVGELADFAATMRVERGQCLDDIRRLLARGAACGQLPVDTDAALATQALHALMVGVMHEWVLEPAAYDLASAAPAIIDVMLAGLQARPPRRAPRPLPRVHPKPVPNLS